MILVEINIDKDSIWCNNFIKDLDPPDECVITCILRDNKTIYPRGNTRILELDNILVLTNNSGLLELKKQFKNGGMKYAKHKK
jgi:NhaP-type Na+/H+ and K+/H+ antiporter